MGTTDTSDSQALPDSSSSTQQTQQINSAEPSADSAESQELVNQKQDLNNGEYKISNKTVIKNKLANAKKAKTHKKQVANLQVETEVHAASEVQADDFDTHKGE